MGWNDEAECDAVHTGSSTEMLNKTGTVETDGSRGADDIDRCKRVAAGAVVFDTEYSDVATIHARIPGGQTVPRAELLGRDPSLVMLDE